ncbi:MAG: hypothetical protein GDA39_00270, partial [Hyphomonadaceae bacterium]|nr:hypothetical protein [Hyphomonadaceae bacterium]
FSRYRAVLEANDDPMPVKTALRFINEELDKFMSSLSGEFDAETRFALTWFEQHGHERGAYGAAENLAQARNMSVEDVKTCGIIESAAGQVRILPRDELGPDPENPPPGELHRGRRPALWTCCQYLVRAHETDGEGAAARVLNILERLSPGVSERARSLAHALYDVCESKRQDAAAAMPYNNMVSVWSEITWVASTTRNRREDDQTEMQV